MTAYGLTERQAEFLALIETYQREHGHAPSYEEMMAAFGLRSRSAVHRMIVQLEARGRIKRQPRRARSIELVAPQVTVDLEPNELAALQGGAAARGVSMPDYARLLIVAGLFRRSAA